jgi:hypothetical protein
LLSARKLLAQIGAMPMLYKKERQEVNEEIAAKVTPGLAFYMKPSC